MIYSGIIKNCSCTTPHGDQGACPDPYRKEDRAGIHQEEPRSFTIRLHHEHTCHGPNPYAEGSVVVATLTLSDSSANHVRLLLESCRLLRAGYSDWLSSGTSSKNPIAAVADCLMRWSLGALNEAGGFLHHAGSRAVPGGARLWIGYHHPKVSRLALKLGLKAVVQASKTGILDRSTLQNGLGELWNLCNGYHPDYQACILMEAARERNIPVLPYPAGSRYWQYGWGCRSRVFLESMSNADGVLGYHLQRSKLLSKNVFTGLGYAVPKHFLVNRPDELVRASETVGWPCVVKPLFSGTATGVTAGLRNREELEEAFIYARCFTKDPIMIEANIPGDYHRLMVIDGKLNAFIRCDPPVVTGDGRRTVEELLSVVNLGRSANMARSRYLLRVETDEMLDRHLSRQGICLKTVPEAGRRITLRPNANLATGGICSDVTDRVHPHVRQMAESVAAAMSLGTVGIDYITTDIEKSWKGCGALIEANTTPGLDVMVAAGQEPSAVGCAVLGGLPGRLPVQLVVVHPSRIGESLQQLEACGWMQGFGWSCNGRAGIEGMALQVRGARPLVGCRVAVVPPRAAQAPCRVY